MEFFIIGIIATIIFCSPGLIAWLTMETKDKSLKESMTNTKNDLVESTKNKIEQTKNSLFHPNTFAKVWTFTTFVDTYGPHVGLVSHTNGVTGRVFFTCEVSDSSGRTKSIRFSSQLGELNATELSRKKDLLCVGQTNSGKYYLYDKHFKAWEDVDLSYNKGEE